MTTTSQRAATSALDVHLLREGRGAPVVLLHGWPEFSGVWRHVMPPLASRYDVVAPDLRGFGRTRLRAGGPVGGTTGDILATDLAELLAALKLDRVAIVSHDVGAFAAQSFARLHPARVAALFFFDVPYPGIGKRWGEAGHLKEVWYQYFHQWPLAEKLVGASRDTMRIYLKHFLDHWAARPGLFDAALEEWVDVYSDPANLEGGFAWYRGSLPMRLKLIAEGPPVLPKITAPTRVLWGAKDPVLKAEWHDRLGDYFADLAVDIAPDAGHFPHWEIPDRATREILAFLERVGW
ncbi:MAG: alpha/beta hydrolase [Alphaproteobacteria bacterium]|nr:alpha/beta hydrolase [Alphaproteobacteria bacterium]